jgi:hypothetical protein
MRRLEVNDEPVAVSNRLDPHDSVGRKTVSTRVLALDRNGVGVMVPV